MSEPISSAAIAAAAGAVLSLVLAFVPGLKARFAAIPQDDKPLIVLALCAAIAVVVLGLTCAGVDTGSGASCPALNAAAVYGVVANVIAAAGTAQIAFTVLVNPSTRNDPESPAKG